MAPAFRSAAANTRVRTRAFKKVVGKVRMVTQRYRYGTLPSSEVAVGSCATDARESGQGRKTAAFIGNV